MLVVLLMLGLYVTGCYEVFAAVLTFILLVAALKKIITTL